jgi:hypothetical protein
MAIPPALVGPWNDLIRSANRQVDLPKSGPAATGLKRYRVDSVTEYLALCEALLSQTDDRHEIFFRGQTNEFLVPGTDKVSLMPVAARVAPIRPDIAARYLLEQRYREYVKSMVDEHLSAIGVSDKGMSDFVKLYTGIKRRSPKNLFELCSKQP